MQHSKILKKEYKENFIEKWSGENN